MIFTIGNGPVNVLTEAECDDSAFECESRVWAHQRVIGSLVVFLVIQNMIELVLVFTR